jgi:16S rRNA (adenine1518-N6/adenine1519-N6)-dimethyltransferase
MIFMLQNEVVKRICAAPNSSDYGRLTVMLQYKYKCRKLLDVPPESFYPAPKVDSAIVSLTPRNDYAWHEVNEEKLGLVVTQAFSQRRKTLANSLKPLFTSAQMIACNIDPQKRAENLAVTDFINLSKSI